MKKLSIIYILIIVLTIGNSIAQEVNQGRNITPDPTTHKELNSWFKKYEMAELDLSALSRMVNKEEGTRISLQIGQNKWNLNLFKNEIRSSNYTSIYSSGNSKVLQEKKACITYAGYIDDNPENNVRLTISDEIFRGFIVVDHEVYYFDQLKRVINNSDKNIIISYRAGDVQENNTSICGVTSEQEKAFLSQVESSALALQSVVSTCRILELATDADFEWFQLYGNNSNNQILAIINMLQGVYQNTFNLEIVVVFQNVFTTVNDPYTADPLTQAGSTALVGEMRTHWENNFGDIDKDLAHLFVGRSSGLDGYVGSAYFETVCAEPDYAYGFSRDWVNQFTTTAHEIGHSFGGLHGDGQFCGTANATVMCVGDKANPLVFSAASTNRIEAFMNANSSCLTDLASVNIIGPSIVCTSNSTFTLVTPPPLGANTTWTVSPSNRVTPSSGNGATAVFRSTCSSIGDAQLTFTTLSPCGDDLQVSRDFIAGGPDPSDVSLVVMDNLTGQQVDTWDMCPNTMYVLILENGSGCSTSNYSWTLPHGMTEISSSQNWALINTNSSYGGIMFVHAQTCCTDCGTNVQILTDVLQTGGYSCGGYYYSYSPNPVIDELTVSAISTADEDKKVVDPSIKIAFEIKIYDSNKVMVRSEKSKENEIVVNTDGLKKGTYFLHIIEREKVIKKEQILVN